MYILCVDSVDTVAVGGWVLSSNTKFERNILETLTFCVVYSVVSKYVHLTIEYQISTINIFIKF